MRGARWDCVRSMYKRRQEQRAYRDERYTTSLYAGTKYDKQLQGYFVIVISRRYRQIARHNSSQTRALHQCFKLHRLRVGHVCTLIGNNVIDLSSFLSTPPRYESKRAYKDFCNRCARGAQDRNCSISIARFRLHLMFYLSFLTCTSIYYKES